MIGVILLLLGAIWTLQGSGVLGGSVMSGERSWLVAGVICLIVGAGLVAWTVAATRRRDGSGSSTDGPSQI
jgi:hypothetical protein